MPVDVSPAAAAAVARWLDAAGLKRAVEYQKGIEWEGYWAAPHVDHVRVEYTPGWDVEPARALAVARKGLARCKVALAGRSLDIREVIDEDYVYGGNPPMAMPVLEVRHDKWTRRR